MADLRAVIPRCFRDLADQPRNRIETNAAFECNGVSDQCTACTDRKQPRRNHMNTDKHVQEYRPDGIALGVSSARHPTSAPSVPCRACSPGTEGRVSISGSARTIAIVNPLIRPCFVSAASSERGKERVMELPNLLQSTASTDEPRLLHVRIPALDHEFIRTLAFSQKVTNADVLSWSIELLRRYVAAGGER